VKRPITGWNRQERFVIAGDSPTGSHNISAQIISLDSHAYLALRAGHVLH
jgi:hypothetical protein